MGVKDLWQLLEPVGRRVNIETLTNKRLAIGAPRTATHAVPLQPPAPAGRCTHADHTGCVRADASIWLHQFLAAMRDQRGEVIHNAHLLGFFRRICRCRTAAPPLPARAAPGSSAPRLDAAPQAAVPPRPPGIRVRRQHARAQAAHNGRSAQVRWPPRRRAAPHARPPSARPAASDNARAPRRRRDQQAVQHRKLAEQILNTQLRAHALQQVAAAQAARSGAAAAGPAPHAPGAAEQAAPAAGAPDGGGAPAHAPARPEQALARPRPALIACLPGHSASAPRRAVPWLQAAGPAAGPSGAPHVAQADGADGAAAAGPPDDGEDADDDEARRLRPGGMGSG
jgi:hypothetical protein